MVSMISKYDRCLFVNEWVILAAIALVHSVTAVMNLATLHMTAPTRFLCQEPPSMKTDLFQGNDTPKPKGTDHIPPTMGRDKQDISNDHNFTTISTRKGAAAVSEGTHHPPHSVTTVAYDALWVMDTPVISLAMTHPISIVTPHPALTSSPADATHTTIPWTRASLTPATLTTLHRKHSQWGQASHTQDLQPPTNPIIPRLSSSRTPHQIPPQIQTVTLIL